MVTLFFFYFSVKLVEAYSKMFEYYVLFYEIRVIQIVPVKKNPIEFFGNIERYSEVFENVVQNSDVLYLKIFIVR